MNKIISLGFFVLITTMVFSGSASSVSAQEDISILLDIAMKAQSQIQKQISDTANVSNDTLKMFTEGKNEVVLLESSIKNNNISSSKKHFLTAMDIFKKVSSLLEQAKSKSQTKSTLSSDPTSELNRIHSYIQNLKLVARNYQLEIDFGPIDSLVVEAREKVSSEKFEDASTILTQIKQQISIIIKKLNDYTQEQNTQRAREYAQGYVEQLDRLIAATKNQAISSEIINKLEIARNNLTQASSTKEIVYQIKEIILLKKQFELTKADSIEAKLIQVQKSIDNLSKISKISQTEIDTLRGQLQSVKDSISEGDYNEAQALLKSIAEKIISLKKSAIS